MSTIVKVVQSFDDWSTPDYIYDALDAKYGFTIDLAASSINAKHQRYYALDEGVDSLLKDWSAEIGFINPPYGRGGPVAWMRKCSDGGLIIALVKAATDTSWFHKCVFETAKKITFIEGRIMFDPPPGYVPPIVTDKKTGVQKRKISGNNHGSVVIQYDARFQRRGGPVIETWAPKHVPLRERMDPDQWEAMHQL